MFWNFNQNCLHPENRNQKLQSQIESLLNEIDRMNKFIF